MTVFFPRMNSCQVDKMHSSPTFKATCSTQSVSIHEIIFLAFSKLYGTFRSRRASSTIVRSFFPHLYLKRVRHLTNAFTLQTQPSATRLWNGNQSSASGTGQPCPSKFPDPHGLAGSVDVNIKEWKQTARTCACSLTDNKHHTCM